MSELESFKSNCESIKKMKKEDLISWENLREEQNKYGYCYKPIRGHVEGMFLSLSNFFIDWLFIPPKCPHCKERLNKIDVTWAKFILFCPCGYRYADILDTD